MASASITPSIRFQGEYFNINDYKKYEGIIIHFKIHDYVKFEQDTNTLIEIIVLLDRINIVNDISDIQSVGENYEFLDKYYGILRIIYKKMEAEKKLSIRELSDFIYFITVLMYIVDFYGKLVMAIKMLLRITVEQKEEFISKLQKIIEEWKTHGITSNSSDSLKYFGLSYEDQKTLIDIIEFDKNEVDIQFKHIELVELMKLNKDINDAKSDDELCKLLKMDPSDCIKENILRKKFNFKEYYIEEIDSFFNYCFDYIESYELNILKNYLLKNRLNNMIIGANTNHPKNEVILKFLNSTNTKKFQEIINVVYSQRKNEFQEQIRVETQQLFELEHSLKQVVSKSATALVEDLTHLDAPPQVVELSQFEISEQRKTKIREQIIQMVDTNLQKYGCGAINKIIQSRDMEEFINFASKCNFSKLNSINENTCNMGCLGESIYGELRKMEKIPDLHSNPWYFLHRECIHKNIQSVLPIFYRIVENCFPSIRVKIEDKIDSGGRLQLYLNFTGKVSGRGHVSLHPGIDVNNHAHIKLDNPEIEISIGFMLTKESMIVAMFPNRVEPEIASDIVMIQQILNIFLFLLLVCFKFKKILPITQISEKKYMKYNVKSSNSWETKYLKYKAKYIALKKLVQ